MQHTITVVGAGNVGGSAAHACLTRRLGDVVLLDINEKIPRGKALDLSQAAVLEGHGCNITGSADYADSALSDVVVVTAGVPRKPGMSRDDLLRVNADIVGQITKNALKYSPDAVFIIAANPVDVMCMVAHQAGIADARRIIGLSGVLDTARLRAETAQAAEVPGHAVQGLVIGEHGDSMVPLPRFTSVGGLPAALLLTQEQTEQARRNTVSGGSRIMEYMGSSAYYAPGAALAVMVEAVLRDKGDILPCSAYLKGEYGIEGIFMCMPVRLGAHGVENIIILDLTDEEKDAVARSAAGILAKTAAATAAQ
ncbi:MAG: malate dehydrogenase [Desulfovibrio sp.]|jgi:malate dehydrogenase|nr:malate dehydrogenase [Desulfovibrio sp.]